MLSFMVGFLSLSQELLWVRVVSFAQGGTPMAFGFVLSLYLIGIAAGAVVGKYFCARSSNLYGVAAWTLTAAAATDALPSLLGPYIGRDPTTSLRLSEIVLPAIGIVVTSGLKSILFPIAHHLGSQQSGKHVGSSVSRIYLGNILGSTAGPILTGFWLLDRVSIDTAFALIAIASGLLAIACAFKSTSPRTKAQVATTCVAVFSMIPLIIEDGAFAKSAANKSYVVPLQPGQSASIAHLIENKHGIVHTVSATGRNDDVVYGGNMFDGRVNVGLDPDTNGISRIFAMAALHDAPKRVLVVGLSAGPWTRAVTSIPSVEHIDAIDINPAYVELTRRYAEVSPLLSDPRVKIHIDDGRRWLRRNPDTRYDLVVMNNTLHFRAYSTNLLSIEFFNELRRHMNPGAVVGFNTTGSMDAALTAQSVFPHVHRHASFVYASATPFVPSFESAQDRLTRLRLDGRPVFDASAFASGASGHKLATLATRLLPVSAMFANGHGHARVITDLNLITEYRHGQRFEVPPLRWLLPPKEQVGIKD